MKVTTNFEAMRDELTHCRNNLLASKALNTELLAALKETLVWIDDPEAKQAVKVAIARAEEKP